MILDASEDLGIVMLTNYHGLPRETFNNFGWHKSFIYDFAITPIAYSPVSVHYGKRYIEYDKLTINNSYDNGLRIYRKTNSRFNNETFQYFDSNGLMSGILYRPLSGYTGCWPSGKLNFGRDSSVEVKMSPVGIASLNASGDLGIVMLQITEDLALTANYNPDLEITSVNHTVPQSFDESYTYDSRGNRLTDLTKTYLYDNLNKLIDSTTHLYGYDLDGNLTLEKNKLTGETKKYYWDSENRLNKYEHQATDLSPVDIIAEYKYDIFGRRIQKNTNGSITNFLWKGDNLSLELDSSNQPIRKYFTETGLDNYFGQMEYSEVTNWSKIFDYNYPQGWYGYLKDQVGTIYRVWDRNLKQYAETRTYDTFGNQINFTGTTKTNLGFQGKYYDTESGINYYYHRYYSPSIGRFISEDPIGMNGGLNVNNSLENDPINLFDPYGLMSWDFNWPSSSDELWDSWPVSRLIGGSHGYVKPFGDLIIKCDCKKMSINFSMSFKITINLESWKSRSSILKHEFCHIIDWYFWYKEIFNQLSIFEKFQFESDEQCKDYARRLENLTRESSNRRDLYTKKNCDSWWWNIL